MAEAMTAETIIQAYWQIQGYWTEIRFPFQTKNKGWSDIDVLAYDPETKTLVISESKVQGPKHYIYAYTQYTKDEYGSIFDFDSADYLGFINHIPIIAKNEIVFDDFHKMVKHIIIQLVSNYYIGDEIKKSVLDEIKKKVITKLPKGVEYKFRMDTTFDIICEIIKLEKENPQGRRYGNPILDVARELNRYMNPTISYAGRKKEPQDKIKTHFKDIIRKVLELD